MSEIHQVVDVVKPYLAKWYTILFGALVIFYLANEIKVRTFLRKTGAVKPKIVSTPWFNIPVLLELLKMKSQGKMTYFIQSFFERFGSDTFVFRFVGVVPLVFTQEPENIKAVLATKFNDFALGTRHAHFDPLLGDGIFTLDNQGWKDSRAMLRPQFAREQVAHVKALEPHLQVFKKHVEVANGQPFDIQLLFHKLTVDTATEFLFGESCHSLFETSFGPEYVRDDSLSIDFAKSFNVAQSYLATRSYSQYFYFLVNNSEFRNSCKLVHNFASFYVKRALAFSPEELEEKSANGYTFLYELVKQTRDPKALQDQLLNILLAGRDTTAGLLSFTFYELARNPDIFEKLKEEIYTAFGSGDDARIEDITFESLKKCEYLKWVLNEALRLYPSVPINFRVATRDTVLPHGGGKDGQQPMYVGKGTTVAYPVFCTHRLQEYYGKDADVFRPERWADIRKIGWAYVPFNGGPRICLGQQFALTEASYVVTRLIQMFPNLTDKNTGPYPPRLNCQLTMCLQDGCHVTMT